jgi:hypothetical protein
MVRTEAVEGIIDKRCWFHVDFGSDVLYLRLVDHLETPALGEEQEDGSILLRSEEDDEVIGLTIVGWWKQVGQDDPPDSIREIVRYIEPCASKLAG